MRLPVALVLLLIASPALAQDDADTPSFDRPGIGFSPSTLPRGSVALEWGLPSLERDRDADGGADDRPPTVDLVGLGDRLDDAVGKLAQRAAVVHVGQQHLEFVTTEPPAAPCPADRALKALGHTEVTARPLPLKAHAVEVVDGKLQGGSDPRSEGRAVSE